MDAAVADLDPSTNIAHTQGYHPSRNLVGITALGDAMPGDRVFKVGQASGHQTGTVEAVAILVGPMPYSQGETWFEHAFSIEGDASTFSRDGDSGAAVVTPRGELVGVLFGDGVSPPRSFANPIKPVFAKLGLTLPP
jgi:hypothetical protein